ncbi:putative c2 domain-containing protein [Diaporthe ampelina]|uniref:Putative c2 domain-containing protein n=1 Tax=Diaporthe ampelina TaxID=1214573 RepID=A0A0G2FTM9_9PEZI|nr:putative c2 domain-containing protein [Diaporthe ampelina]
MAGLVDRLTASGGTESAGFLNDIVAQLWPNINIAGCRMVKEIVEPILASTLPGPLSSLRFTKLDLGQQPIRISEVDVHKTQNGGIKLDMDILWDGKSDIDLEGSLVPKLGIKNIHLKGRLSILLAPLTNIIPLIGAAQVAFINPPYLKLDFTDAANIADCFLVDKAIRKVILNIVSSMAVLPNRFLVKLDSNNDYFKTYLPHLGALRLTVEKATGVQGPKKNAVMKMLNKIVKDVPDCYCKVAVGAEEEWRTTTKKDENNPEWNETHDFLVADNDQEIVIDVQDEDLGSDDDIGIATTTVKDILLDGGSKELQLFHKGDLVDARVSVRAEFYHFVDDAGILSSQADGEAGQMVGLATVLIGSVSGLQGQRDELNPCVKVSWGEKEFLTAAKSYTPGTDIFNPSFDQAFRIPLTAELLANPASFKLTLLNKKDETGAFEIPFSDILQAPGLIKEDSFTVGLGVTVRASISLRALKLAH